MLGKSWILNVVIAALAVIGLVAVLGIFGTAAMHFNMMRRMRFCSEMIRAWHLFWPIFGLSTTWDSAMGSTSPQWIAHHSKRPLGCFPRSQPQSIFDKDTRHAYWVATQNPAVLNELYCWCGCENRGERRSNLQCFEAEMAVTCPVCQGTAEIAYQMTRGGIQDAGKIQAAVDAKWAPKS
jgi:hypothetical protein